MAGPNLELCGNGRYHVANYAAIGDLLKGRNMPVKRSKRLDRKFRKSANTRKRTKAHSSANKSKFVDLQTIEAADEIFQTAPEELVGSRRGRPSLISDPHLYNRRDNLVQIFEACWGEIGWRLQKSKTPDEVIPILNAWPVGMSED